MLKDVKDIIKEQAQEAVKASSDANSHFYISTTKRAIKADVKEAIADTVLAIASYITPYSSAVEILDTLIKYGVFLTDNKTDRNAILSIAYDHNMELDFPDLF